jgi:hypothetical protein
VSRDFWYTSWSRGAISLLSSLQLIEFIDDLTKNLQEGLQTDELIMDFAKSLPLDDCLVPSGEPTFDPAVYLTPDAILVYLVDEEAVVDYQYLDHPSSSITSMTSKTGYDPLFDYLRTTLSPTSL